MARALKCWAFSLVVFGSSLAWAGSETPSPDLRQPGPLSLESGWQQKLGEGVEVCVGPNTELVVMPRTRTKLNGPEGPVTGLHFLKLSAGRIAVAIAGTSLPEHSVLVRGPGEGSAIPLHGKALIMADPAKTTVANLEGETLVASGESWKPLLAGRARVFEEGRTQEGTPEPAALVSFELGPKLQLVTAGHPGRATVSLTPVEEASGYRLDVWQVTAQGRSLVSSRQETGTRFELDGLRPGRYQVAVTALLGCGIAGPTAPEQELRIIGVEEPPGAVFHRGTLLLSPGDRVKLLEGDGLSMTYGRASKYFVRAPEDFGLARGQTDTTVRFRLPSSEDEAQLTLRSRPYRVDVVLGPPGARWPDEPVQIVVQARDRRGRLVQPPLAKPMVTVNDRPVHVPWRTRSGVLLGSLLPFDGPGPWLVRVEVSDSSGPVTSADLKVTGRSERLTPKEGRGPKG